MSGFTNDIMAADNVDFSGGHPVAAQITQNGQLLIGSNASPNIRPGFITSLDGSINVNNTSGNIDLSGSSSPFQPNAVLQDFDDFISANIGGNVSKLTWVNFGTVDSRDGENGHPGILTFTASNDSYLTLYQDGLLGTLANPIPIGSGELFVSWTVRLRALSGGGNTYRFSVGMVDGDTVSGASDSFVNGIYFQYTDSANSGNWTLKCTNTSVTTTVNTSTPATTNFTTLAYMVNAAGTLVSYYIDNLLVGTIATNIPTASISPTVYFNHTLGAANPFDIDLFLITLNLSNPRPGPIPGTTPANGRLILNYVQTAVDYNVLGVDAIIGVTDTSAPRTITLPNAGLSVAQEFTIKDESGGASINPITLDGNGFDIDSAGTTDITSDYGSLTVYFNGSKYFII